jgi:pre-mRNA cleavage complex 2 protein Pcf11
MDASGDSAEIVEDFKEALLDLKVNSKPEIDVLTVIAKENTTYAEAISDVVEEHIKTVSLAVLFSKRC